MFVSFLLLAFGMVAFAQQPASTSSDTANGPYIRFEKVVHDYGTLEQGADGTCEFKFTNTGNEPLILNKPTSSCGCTVPTWPKEPILPGKGDVIKVTYATHNVGIINKTVTVTSNAKNSRVVLSIKGTVIAKPTETLPEKAPAEGTPDNK